MREAQREYFSTRSHEALQKARSLERSVDAYIKRGDDYLKKQKQEPTLFDNENRTHWCWPYVGQTRQRKEIRQDESRHFPKSCADEAIRLS